MSKTGLYIFGYFVIFLIACYTDILELSRMIHPSFHIYRLYESKNQSDVISVNWHNSGTLLELTSLSNKKAIKQITDYFGPIKRVRYFSKLKKKTSTNQLGEDKFGILIGGTINDYCKISRYILSYLWYNKIGYSRYLRNIYIVDSLFFDILKEKEELLTQDPSGNIIIFDEIHLMVGNNFSVSNLEQLLNKTKNQIYMITTDTANYQNMNKQLKNIIDISIDLSNN